MTQVSVTRISGVLTRFGNPLTWSVADRVLLMAAVVFPLTVWYLAVFHYLMAHPAVATFVDRTVLANVITMQTAVVAAWLALIVAVLIFRRRFPDSRLYTHAVAVVFAATAFYFAYSIGPFNSMFAPAAFLAGPVVGWILLDQAVVSRWVLGLLGCYFVTIALTQAGTIPYAPLLLSAPFENGRLDRTWILTIDSVGCALLPICLLVFYYLISSWRTHETQLAQARDQLARANEIISHYIPSQVATGIMNNELNPAIKYERRKLTVFFSDVRNFTEIADKLEPEDMSHILNEYLCEMTNIAERHGGTLDHYLGDGILIYFGAPLATDDQDHAVRAIRMGLEMQARVRELSAKWQNEVLEHPFEIRIGINTGHASVGNFGTPGRMAYMAVGRPVNLAARLQSHCTPGQILLSHSTWLLVRDTFPCADKGEIQVKGSHFPVRVYEVSASPDEVAVAAQPA